MLCQACNADVGDTRTLAMTRRDGGIEYLEMTLCETCFEGLTAESWIEPAGIAAE
jgi:hypothetical protein